MTTTTKKGRGDRFSIPLEVYCSFERVEGTATLANISYTGALVEDSSIRPEIGTRIKLYVYLKPPRAFEAETPFELTGVVSRHSSDGFAVKFEDSRDPDLRRMVDDAAAIVATRR
jgi:hypothetical protein